MTLPKSVGAWLGQATTGAGFMAIVSTISAVASHQITWQLGVIGAVGSLILLIWPEQTAAAAASKPVVADLEQMVLAYRTGLQHGSANAAAMGLLPQVPGLLGDLAGLAAAAQAPAAPAPVTTATVAAPSAVSPAAPIPVTVVGQPA